MRSTLRLPVLSWAELKLVMHLDAMPRQRRTAAGGEKIQNRIFNLMVVMKLSPLNDFCIGKSFINGVQIIQIVHQK